MFVLYRKGKPLKESERHIITSEGTIRRLVIKKTVLEDQTDYTCVAGNVKTSSKLKLESKLLSHTAAVTCHILKSLVTHQLAIQTQTLHCLYSLHTLYSDCIIHWMVWVSIPGRSKRCVSSSVHPDNSWDSPSLLSCQAMMLSSYLHLTPRLRMWLCGVSLTEWNTEFHCLAWMTIFHTFCGLM